MTQTELNQELNYYKIEYNKVDEKIDSCSHAIKTFQELQTYFLNCEKKIKTKKTISAVTLGICLPLSLLFLPFAIPLSLILFAVSICACERTLFFKKISKKFEHCTTYATNVLNNLCEKQSSNFHNRSLMMEKINYIDKIISSSKHDVNNYTSTKQEEVSCSI